MKLSHIFQYPVKGLSPHPLSTVALNVGCGLPNDRRFAFTHGRSKYDFADPCWVARRNFLVVAHCPRLTALTSCYHSATQQLTLCLHDEKVLELDLGKPGDLNELNRFLTDFISDYQYGPYGIAEVSNVSLTDSPVPAISLMNLASLAAIENAAGQALDKQRFRGNLWFDGEYPWQEFDWIGQEITIGDVRLEVFESIERCAAINANPQTGKRDFDGLRLLQNRFSHRTFGVLAKVKSDGRIQLGDLVQPY